MIFLSFSDSSLFCTIWPQTAGDSILTHIVQIPLTGNLNRSSTNDKVFNSILEQAFKSLTTETQLDGHEAIITIPDHWVHHDFTLPDKNMVDADIWDYLLWQKSQRFGDRRYDYLTFAEHIQNLTIHVMHVPAILVSGLKLSIAETGTIPVWLGTESMTFTGPTIQSFAVCLDAGSAYNIYIVTKEELLTGTVRFLKGNWKASKSFGFGELITNSLKLNPKELGKILQPVYALDRLSKSKEVHWTGHELKYIEPFRNANTEKIESFDDISYHFLAVQSILHDDRFSRSELNYFEKECLIERKKGTLEKEKSLSEKKPPGSKTKPTKIIKIHKRKRKNGNKKLTLIIVATTIISLSFILVIYLTEFEKLNILGINRSKFALQTGGESKIINGMPDNKYPDKLVLLINQSFSMMKSIRFIFNNIRPDHLSFLSVSSGNMQLEIVNDKKIDIDMSPLGILDNYSIKGIDCCGGYKHFYDFHLQKSVAGYSDKTEQVDNFITQLSQKSYSYNQLQSINNSDFLQTPFIIKTDSREQTFTFFQFLQQKEQNVILRKMVITGNPGRNIMQSVFYISVFEHRVQ